MSDINTNKNTKTNTNENKNMNTNQTVYSKSHQDFINDIADSFKDLRDVDVELKFSKNKTFQKEFKLDKSERILYLNYKNLWFTRFKVLAPSIIVVLSIISLLLFIDFSPVDTFLMGFLIGCLIFVIIVAGILLVIASISASSYRYIITDRRIIIGYTFIRRWVRSIYFSNIIDIVVKQGLFARIFKSGNILILTGSNEGIVLNTPDKKAKNVLQSRGFLGIKYPFRVKKLLYQLYRRFSTENTFKPELEHFPISLDDLDSLKLGLGPNEYVFKNYRRKRASSFFKLIGIIGAIFFFLLQILPIGTLIESDIAQTYSLILLGVIVFSIVIIFWISKFHSRAFRYIVTNQRIIMYNDFFNIRCRDIIMGKITEVALGQMVVGRIGNFGDIKIATKGYEGLGAKRAFNTIEGIPDSNHEKDAIQNIVLFFQKGEFYNPMIEIYDPEFLSI